MHVVAGWLEHGDRKAVVGLNEEIERYHMREIESLDERLGEDRKVATRAQP